MTAKEFKIFADDYWKINTNIINGLIILKPSMSTKEVCKFLHCERHWLSKNRDLFNGETINKRGDLKFDSTLVVKYKRKINR